MNRYGGDQRSGGPVQLRAATVRIPLTTVVVAWLVRRVWAGCSWLVRHPRSVLVAVVVVLMWRWTAHHGPILLLGVLLLTDAGGLAWWHLSPETFTRQVMWRARGAWRHAVVYRYSWQPATTLPGLAVRVDGKEYLPRILSVRSTGHVDQVRVRMLPGQTLTDWSEQAERLAQTFGATDCRVRSVPRRVHDLVLWFLIDDPLTAAVPLLNPAEAVDLTAIPIGLREDGLEYRLRLLGTHLLIGGATGSGKGSVLWSIIIGPGPAIRARLVEVWAIDPKGGMELSAGGRLFARFSYGDGDPDGYESDFAKTLEAAVEIMRARQTSLRGRVRVHTPTVAEPLVVVVVDELASLTAYVSDRDAKRRIANALSLLLSQGRAVGVTVIGALQDPRKEILPFRDLFPTRIALRLNEATQVGMILGDGARARGAVCHQIPESLPGVGYVALDGQAEPVRVRFSWVADDQIAAMADMYAPDTFESPAVVASPGPAHDLPAHEHGPMDGPADGLAA